MKSMITIGLGLALALTSTAAFAKKHPTHASTPQGHHCQVKGEEVSKSKTACKKAGGTWEKGVPAAKAAAPAPADPIK